MGDEEVAVGDHLAICGRVLLLDAEIAPARKHFAAAHDDGADWVVPERGFLEREPHEFFVFGGRRAFDATPKRRASDRQRQRAERECGNVPAAQAARMMFQVCIFHRFASRCGARLGCGTPRARPGQRWSSLTKISRGDVTPQANAKL